MQKRIKIISSATIQNFVNTLRLAAGNGALIYVKQHSQEMLVVNLLKSASLITIEDHTTPDILRTEYDPVKNLIIYITVEGAERLLQWEKLLKENSLKYKLLSNLDRLAWLIVGAVIVSLPKLLS